MNRKPHTLNARGLIAAAVAAASGSALAEQAGRVSFVTGDVRATATDGSVRSLARGDIINTGDKINTGAGRLQLRFTDGGFVSLQPNTVFGVDQYLYANKPPEETSLFFSLLQGGMRTVTGAIGKVNKQSYKVRTPVATIGIRGTEFRARVNPKRTVVSVGSGFVNVSNERGNITAGAGQNIEASLTTGPRMTNDEADVNATGPEGEREQYVAEDSEDQREQRQAEQLLADGNNEELANLLNPDGTPHPVPTYIDNVSLPNGSGYSLTTTDGNGGIVTVNGLTATFNPTTGAISSLTVPGTSPTNPQAIVIEAPPGASFSPGTLQFVNNKRFGNIGFGEITDGSTTDNTLGIFPSSVAPGEYFSYMMAVPSAPSFTSGKASYSLQGGSAARLDRGETTGKLEHFNFDVNLLTARASIDMLISSATVAEGGFGDISVSGSGLNLSPGLSTFGFTSGLSTSGAFCGTLGCSTEISGFFVGGGSQAAATYNIQRSGSSITGYAALGQSKYTDQQTGSYSILMPNGSDALLDTIIRDSGGRLISYANCSDGCYYSFDSGTLQFSNVGHSGDIYWGEYTNGEGTFFYSTSGAGEGAALSASEFQAYIVGPQSTPSFSGTAHYTVQTGSGTRPRLNGGTTTGTLDHFNLDINLGSALAAVDLQVTLAGETFNASESGLSLFGSSGQFSLSDISTFSNGDLCSGGCYTDITGFFSGTAGDKLGTAYYISDGETYSITGTAVLGHGGNITPDPVANEPETGYSLLTVAYGEGGFSYYHAATLAASFNSDNTIANLTSSQGCEGVYCPQFEPGTLKTVSQGSTTNLRWGEYTNGSADYYEIAGLPDFLSSTEFVGYIIGKQLSSAALDGNASAVYTLQPGSATRSYGGAASATGAKLDSFVIKLNLFAGLADLAATFSAVGSLDETVTVSGSRVSLPLLGMGLKNGNLVDSYPGLLQLSNGLSVASSQQSEIGGFCYAITCSANILGILAGDSSEIGVSYNISGNGTIVGVAALAQAGPPSTATDTSLESGGGYVLVADRGSEVILSNADPYNDFVATANFDQETGALQDVTVPGSEGPDTLLNGSSATLSDTGTYKTLHWGRLSGAGVVVGYNKNTITLGDAAGPTTGNIHYVVGTLTDPQSWHALNHGFQGATASYSVVNNGSTTPTDSAGNTGTLNSAKLTLTLDYLPSVAVELDVSMGGNNYFATGSNSMAYVGSGPFNPSTAAAATFNISNMATTVNSQICSGSCASTSVHGFFSGSQAQQAGMSYSIVDPTAATTITGAAALKADTLVPAGG